MIVLGLREASCCSPVNYLPFQTAAAVLPVVAQIVLLVVETVLQAVLLPVVLPVHRDRSLDTIHQYVVVFPSLPLLLIPLVVLLQMVFHLVVVVTFSRSAARVRY